MAHILCVTTGLTGIVNSSLALMRQLEQQGHRVLCCCPEDVEQTVKNHGFAYRQLPPLNFNPAPGLPSVRGKWWRLPLVFLERLKKAKSIGETGIRNIEPVVFKQILREEGIELVLCDLEAPEYIIECCISNIPVIAISQFFSLSQRPKVPPIDSRLMPGNPFSASLSWWRLKMRRYIKARRKSLLSVFTERRSLLKGYARSKGLKPEEIIYGEYYWPGPFLFKGMPTINMVSTHLDFPGHLRSDEINIGPMVEMNRKDDVDAQDSMRLNEALDHAQKRNQKIIYCAMSSMTNPGAALIAAIRRIATQHQDWMILLGNPTHQGPFEDELPNFRQFRKLSAMEVLPRSSCAIITAGINSLNECIVHGVPMLIYSLDRFDQNGNASRVRYHQVGRVGDWYRDDARAVDEHVARLLDDDGYREKMNRLKELIEEELQCHALEAVVRAQLDKKTNG